MFERAERFARRRQERVERERRAHLREVADPADVAALLAARDGAEDHAAITAAMSVEVSIEADPQAVRRDADAMLDAVRKEFDAARIDELMVAARRGVIESIAAPFGVGHLVARSDTKGGPVTTVHNAEAGVFAKEGERANYRKQFVRRDYEKKGALPRKLENRSGYTGRVLEDRDKPEIDHIVSLKSVHDDKLLRLSTTVAQRREIANNQDNLAFAERTINRSKGRQPYETWSARESPDGLSNAARNGVDPAVAQATVTKANAAKARQKRVAVAQHFGGEVALAGGAAAAGLGVQQALGLLAAELADGLFDEMKDVLAHGFKGGAVGAGFLDALGARLGRVGKRLLRRWKDVLRAFGDGALAGALSAVMTVVINTFLTTARNVVRMIREGAASLWKAVKLLVSPPPGMTLREAAHEASKIILAGVVVVGGALLEEAIAKLLGGFPMAAQLNAVLVGIVSGLAMTFGAWLLDKLDLLGVVAEAKDADVAARLEPRRIAARDALERSLAEIELMLTPGEVVAS